MYRVASSHSSKIGLFPPSDTNLFCGFNRGVFTVLVFALHPDSLMMLVVSLVVFALHPDSLVLSGACLKSGSISKYCPV